LETKVKSFVVYNEQYRKCFGFSHDS